MSDWRPDVLAGFEQRTIELADAPRQPGEPEDTEISATLVRPIARGVGGRPAVLYLHGWNDYFFQTHLAEFWESSGYAFYALDLRRYGRSFREGQLFGFTTDLGEYAAEIGAALDIIGADHEAVVLSGHSTGGLIAALYAADHGDQLGALVLNSPWLDLQGTPLVRTLGPPVVQSLTTLRPTTPFRLPDPGFNRRSTHVDDGGEWDFDLELKGGEAALIRAGWLQAVLTGHQRVARGLSILCPILVLASSRSIFRRSWDDAMLTADVVLDVRQIAERAVRLGPRVTVIRIEDGMHDLVLSAPPVRERVFAEMGQWLRAYGPGMGR